MTALRAIGERAAEQRRKRRQALGLAAVHIGGGGAGGGDQPVARRGKRTHRLLLQSRGRSRAAEETEGGAEGSVSMPGIRDRGRCGRSGRRWRFDGRRGLRQHSGGSTDFAARVAQHEIDQMNGIFFLERAVAG